MSDPAKRGQMCSFQWAAGSSQLTDAKGWDFGLPECQLLDNVQTLTKPQGSLACYVSIQLDDIFLSMSIVN